MSDFNTECHECQVKFFKNPREIRKSKTGKHFCSRSCAAKHNNKLFPKREVEGSCFNCSEQIPAGRKYCDECYILSLKRREKKSKLKDAKLAKKKDSITKNNKTCIDCGDICKGKKRCQKCSNLFISNSINKETLGECIYYHLHKSSAYAKVRTRARLVAKRLGWTKCCICGYDKHIEIDHIKPISEFDLNCQISEINHEDNLRPVCRNCHWELQHLS